MGRERALRRAIALISVGLGGLVLALTAFGSPAAKPPPKKGTTTVITTTVSSTTTVATTTTVPSTTTVAATTTLPAPPPPPPPPAADIALTTLAPVGGPLYAGSTVTYASVVKNNGPDEATGVSLSVDPSGATIVGAATASGSCTGSATLSCALGSLASGASAVVTVTLSPGPNSSSLVDAAQAWADQQDPQDGNNSTHSETAVLAGHPGAPVLATPGGAFQPPLFAKRDGGGRLVSTSVHVDEPATIFVQVLDANGKAVPMLPRTLVDYLPALRTHTVIPHAVAKPHWVQLSIRIGGPAGKVYRLVVRAVAPNGTAATSVVHFTT